MLITLLLFNQVHAESHHPSRFLNSIKGDPQEGAKIVKHFCAVCHESDPEIALGAPRMTHFEDWKPRLKQGIDALFEHTDQGLNLMPPRGGCFECTDKQLMLAIEALIGNDGQKYIKRIKKNH